MKEVLKKIAKKYKWGFMIQILFIMINMYLLTYPPKIIGNIIDLLYQLPVSREKIILAIGYLIGVSIVLLVIRTIWKYYDTYLPRSVEKEIKNKLFSQLLKLKIGEIHKKKNGEMMSYFVKDINEIRAATGRIFSYGTRLLFTLIFASYAMVTNVNATLTFVTLLPMVITGFLIVKIKDYMESSFRKAQLSFSHLSEYIQESTDAIRTTKAYSQEKQQLKNFIRINKQLKGNNNTVDIHSTLLNSTVNIGFGICYGIALLYGSKLVLQGTITVGDFVTFNSYITLFVGPVSWLPNLIARTKRAQVSYVRLDEVFGMEREKINTKRLESDFFKKEKLRGDIDITNLSFQYPGYVDTVLKDICIHLKKGETLGIMGTIGSGKTTLMNLLARLYTVDRGMIAIDGKDINDIPIEDLRDNISYITQDNFLFSAKIHENISLFRDDYEEEDIKQSTKKSVIYDEISSMPEQLDTIIGDSGADLSGGQKQRIAISRAFLKQSSILIFDDTFSALDNRTEEKLLENIHDLVEDKTCILISNRVSDVKHSDVIIILENGQIQEQGKHQELLDKRGKYYNYYQQQAVKTEDSLLN